MKKKLMAGLSGAAVTAALVFGSISQSPVVSAAPAPGTTIRGAVGGDFDSQLPAGSVNGADWGVDQQFRPAATNLIHDGNVFVVVGTWTDAGGQIAPTTTDGPGPCVGTAANPTAPEGDVCIYVLGSDNAVNLAGYSIAVGSGGSKYGFKLLWDAVHNGDTYVDAVWAYHYPA